jgi:hypothetical protein
MDQNGVNVARRSERTTSHTVLSSSFDCSSSINADTRKILAAMESQCEKVFIR